MNATFPAAYNAPASISVNCGWDFDIFASFIYWHVSEEGLDYAFVGATYGPPFPVQGTIAYQDFAYKPGFQAGFGFNTNYDDWVGWVEYTWLHQSVSTSRTAPTLSNGTAGTWGTTIFGANPLGSDWFPSSGRVSNTYTVAASSWRMHLDMLDAMFSRPFYQGTQLTVSPYAGLRALWIRQRMMITMSQSATTIPVHSTTLSNSWAIGSAVGTEGHWLLGSGFRFKGNAAGAVLFTQYTKITTRATFFSTSGAISTITNYNTLCPMAQLGVGLGWGSYTETT